MRFFLAFGVEFKRFFPNHCLEKFLSWLKIIPGPVKWIVALWLGFLIVKTFKVWMFQTLLHCVPLLRVEYQHFSKKIQSHWVSFGVKTGPTLLVTLW